MSPRPVPGRPYTTQRDGETIEDISAAATGGNGKALPIYMNANAHVKSSTTKLPKGTVVIIPGNPAPRTIQGRASHDLTCVIDKWEVPLMEARIIRSMDTGCDGWTGRIAWTPGKDPNLDKITRPFGYPRASVYIGNTLVLAGVLYGVTPELTPQGSVKELSGYSFTADAVDSTVMPPYEMNGLTLKQIADWYCGALGIKAVFEGEWGGAFSRVTANEGERIFDFLAKLASQRGGLVSNTAEGDMLFWRARETGGTVGTLQEGDGVVTSWSATYDGRKRWHVYNCITVGVKGRSKPLKIYETAKKSTGKAPHVAHPEVDDAVPRTRFQTFRADEVTPGNVHDAARWKRNKHFADALTIPLPVSTWYAPDGTLWAPNTLVTVKSPTLGFPSGYKLLVRSVEFEMRADERTARLNLIPPQAFTGKDLGEVWA